MELATWVQNLDKAVCISRYTHSFEKDMNSSINFSFGLAISLGKGKL